jgi:hypothetical protein
MSDTDPGGKPSTPDYLGWDTSVGRVLACPVMVNGHIHATVQPQVVVGEEIEGAPVVTTDVGRPLSVRLIGSNLPQVGDTVIVDKMESTWVTSC